MGTFGSLNGFSFSARNQIFLHFLFHGLIPNLLPDRLLKSWFKKLEKLAENGKCLLDFMIPTPTRLFGKTREIFFTTRLLGFYRGDALQ